MKSSTTWQRVSRRRPCRVCGKSDWCVYTGSEDSPEATICARVESAKRCGEAGWLHCLRNDGPTWSPRVRRIELSAARIGAAPLDFGKLAQDFRAAVRPEALDKLAALLGVSAESLMRLGIGWSSQHRGWCFPMSNASGKAIGIRLRLANGRKLSIRSGHEGLFVPVGFDVAGGLVVIAEGPTDTVALVDLGFNAVGRPSCTGGGRLLVELVQKHQPEGVVIMADGDAPGQRGAERLAAVLAAYVQTVRVITPPKGITDMRVWKQTGATAADVQAVIDAEPVRRLTITTTVRRRKAGIWKPRTPTD